MPEHAGTQPGAVDAAAAAPQEDLQEDLQADLHEDLHEDLTAPPAALHPDAVADAPSTAPVDEGSKADAPTPDGPKPDTPKIEASRVEHLPKVENLKIEVPQIEVPRIEVEVPQIEVPRIEAAKVDVPNIDAAKPGVESRPGQEPGNVVLMAPSDGPWGREDFAPHVKAETKQDTDGKRRPAAMAAMIALAAFAGAVSGALATAGVVHFAPRPAPAPSNNAALETSVARIDADIVALKANLDHTSRIGVSQFNKTSDRLDRLEKAQVEPMARLAKLSEAVDKLRNAASSPPAQAAAARDTTGSISPTQTAAASPATVPIPLPAPKPDVGRLPTVEGWRLRDVVNGGALIESRSGLYEVYAGDPVPGLGRIDAIRRQDGRWVVVTSKGLIVAR